MTTAQMIDELRRSLGNRTDISEERYVRWLNWAILDICNPKPVRGIPARRFHELEDMIMFSPTVYEGTVNNCTETTLELTGAYSSDIVGARIEVGDYVRTIVSLTANVVGVSPVLPEVPEDGEEFRILRDKFHIEDDVGISPKDSLWAIKRMLNVTTDEEIPQVVWSDMKSLVNGSPTEFARYGDYLQYNVPLNNDKAYRLLIYRYPQMLSHEEPDGRTNLPIVWDEVVVLGAIYRGFDKLMEPERANSAKDKYIRALTTMQDSYYQEDGHISKRITARRS